MDPVIKNKGITYGLILGILLSLFYIYAYAVDLSILTQGWMMGVVFLIILVAGVLVILTSRKGMGGFISFKEAFSAYFYTIVVAFLIQTIVVALIFNVVDPSAKDEMKQLTIDKTEEMLENFNVPSEQIDEAIAKIEQDDNFSFGNQVKNYFISLVVYSVIGLILAAILKKKNPELLV